MYLTPAFFAWILHSFPYFFILLFLTAFYDRSRMTGKYLLPLKNRTHLCPDSYRSRWSGMASHSLLLRRFAPRKVVRLLPDKRGRLTVSILFFYISDKYLILSDKCILLLPLFLPVLFILFVHTYLSFVFIFCFSVCLLAIVMFFTSGATFIEDICNAKSRHVFMPAFC